MPSLFFDWDTGQEAGGWAPLSPAAGPVSAVMTRLARQAPPPESQGVLRTLLHQAGAGVLPGPTFPKSEPMQGVVFPTPHESKSEDVLEPVEVKSGPYVHPYDLPSQALAPKLAERRDPCAQARQSHPASNQKDCLLCLTEGSFYTTPAIGTGLSSRHQARPAEEIDGWLKELSATDILGKEVDVVFVWLVYWLLFFQTGSHVA